MNGKAVRKVRSCSTTTPAIMQDASAVLQVTTWPCSHKASVGRLQCLREANKEEEYGG
jgi:hypothetical protein